MGAMLLVRGANESAWVNTVMVVLKMAVLVVAVVAALVPLGFPFRAYLMVTLGAHTWVVFALWMLVGIALYFSYGRSHSAVGRMSQHEYASAATASVPLVSLDRATAARENSERH